MPATKGARKSQITRHPERLAIELARLAGVSLDKVAERFSVDRDAVWRYMKTLDPAYRAALAADVPIEELAQKAAKTGTSLLDHLGIVRMITMSQLVQANACGDTDAVARLARAATDANVAIGRITGEMLKSPAVTNVTNNAVVFMASPFMVNLEKMFAKKLAPYPAALRAVMDGIVELQTVLEEPPAQNDTSVMTIDAQPVA